MVRTQRQPQFRRSSYATSHDKWRLTVEDIRHCLELNFRLTPLAARELCRQFAGRLSNLMSRPLYQHARAAIVAAEFFRTTLRAPACVHIPLHKRAPAPAAQAVPA